MRDPKDILADIEKNEKIAKKDPGASPPKNRPGIEMGIGAAKERLLTLRDEYGQTVLARSIGMFVFGSPEKVEKFAEIAEDEGETLTLDARKLYKVIAEPVEKAMGRTREFWVTHQNLLMAGLAETGRALGLRSISSPRMTQGATSKDFEGLVDYVRDRVREGEEGDELNKLYLSNELLSAALAASRTGGIPVVVTGATKEEVGVLSKIFGRGYAEIELKDEKEITKNLVITEFQKVAKKTTQVNLTESTESE